MTEVATYNGDVLLTLNDDYDWDMDFVNGQSLMTEGFDTAVVMSIFGEPDFWQNDITNDPSEKYISEFPALMVNGRVDNKTLNDGVAAIKRALQWMIDINAAESIDVTGEVLNVYGLAWTIEIVRGGIDSRYEINWEKKALSFKKAA